MQYKILIVEDESSIRGFLKISLKNNNFIVFEAETGEDGIEKARQNKPDIVILDVMLPGIDGFKVCDVLRNEFSNMGIIMLTARSQDMDKIMGLEFGADDYMVKPFNPTELILRIKALLRRIDTTIDVTNIIESFPFKIDTYAKKIYKNDVEIFMTPKEYMLMKTFMKNPGKAFSRDELLNNIWGWDYFGETKIVDVNIRRLRTKIEDKSSDPKYIETVWGIGYRWNSCENKLDTLK